MPAFTGRLGVKPTYYDRAGLWHHKPANYSVVIYTTTGKKTFWFYREKARRAFIERAKRKRNFVRYLRYDYHPAY